MPIEIRDIRKEDHKKAIQFAIKGMHFDWYMDSPFLLNAYGRYFWYLEINRATQAFAAYVDGRFAGVLLAEIYGEPRKYKNLFQKLYVCFIDAIQKMFFSDGAGTYEKTTEQLHSQYLRNHKPDGEIIFLAADPDSGVKGVGTALLQALEKHEKGRIVFLHTDDACTYQFYQRRGFEIAEEANIVLRVPKGEVPLRCFLFSKTL